MASLIGWIVVGLISIGTLVGVTGIAVTLVMLTVRTIAARFRRGQVLDAPADARPERARAHAA